MSNTTRSTFSEMEWHKIQEAQKQMQDVMRQWPPKEFLMLEQQQRERFRSLDMSAASILQKKMAAMFEPLNRNRAFQEIIEQRKLIENLLTPEIRNQIEQSKELFKNLDTGSMARLQEEIQALTEEPFNNIQEVVRSYSEHIAEINSAINPLIEGLSLQIEEIQKAVSDPLTKALESYQQFLRDPFKDLFPEGFFDEIAQQKNFIDYCQEKGWVPHPVLYSFFGDDFFDLSDAEQEEKIQENWEEFSSFLWERLPHNLMGNGREQRLKQIYDAQKVGAYTPVCRSVYPEIESFAHEYLGSDTDFIESLKKISSGGMRIRAVSKKINTIFKIKESPIAKLYISDLGGLLGFRTMEVLLTKTRKEFVPFDETDDDSSINRHFHSHGIPYNASFKDSVNALLLLDTALQAFSALKDQIDGEPINNDH